MSDAISAARASADRASWRAMRDRVDLDVAVHEITRRLPSWRAAGMTVGDVTWRDAAVEWPRPLTTIREDVVVPESVGIRCSKDHQEGSLVLFNGGWADLIYLS